MAKEDARLREQGMPTTNIIGALAAAMPHRTREAIKSRRYIPGGISVVNSYIVVSGEDGEDGAPLGASRALIDKC